MKTNLTIAITGWCNLTCPTCPAGRKEISQPRYMSVELFKSVLDRALSQDVNPAVIDLNGYSEAVLNKDIGTIISHCKARLPGIQVRFSTNLQVVNNIPAALGAGVDEIWVSCSGWSQATYGRTHGGDFARLLVNLEWLPAARDKYNPKTVISFRWHRYRHNELEEAPAQTFVEDLGYKFEKMIASTFPIESILNGDYNQVADILLVPTEAGLAITRTIPAARHCPELDSLMIDVDGQVRLCCYAKEKVADFLTTPLAAIAAQRANHTICKACSAKNVLQYIYATHPKLLDVAINNSTTSTRRTSLSLQRSLYNLGSRASWLVKLLPYHLKSAICKWIREQ